MTGVMVEPPASSSTPLTRYFANVTRVISEKALYKDFWKDLATVINIPPTKPFDLELCEYFIGDDCKYEALRLAHNLGVWASGLTEPLIAGLGSDAQKTIFMLASQPDSREVSLRILHQLVDYFLFPGSFSYFALRQGDSRTLPFDSRRVRRLFNRLRILEDIHISAQYDLAGKFYRDHILHTIRDVLLVGVIGTTDFALDRDQTWSAIAAALFHDMAYPITSALATVSAIQSTLNGFYSTFGVGPPTVSPRQNARLEFQRLFAQPEVVDRLVRAHTELNHAAVGALEFLSLFRVDPPTPPIIDAARAIALHDPGVNLEVKYSEYPVAFVFIIADELQDWGRPVGSSRQIPLAGLGDFRQDDKNLYATMDVTIHLSGPPESPIPYER